MIRYFRRFFGNYIFELADMIPDKFISDLFDKKNNKQIKQKHIICK